MKMKTTFWLLESADGCKQLIPALSDRADNYVWTALTYLPKVGTYEMALADAPTLKRRRYELVGRLLHDVAHYRECYEEDFK